MRNEDILSPGRAY